MWIRSQNKFNLTDSKAIVINDKTIYGGIDGGIHGNGVLGEYKTQARAIEILTEIVDWATSQENDKSYNNAIDAEYHRRDLYPVYQMPKE